MKIEKISQKDERMSDGHHHGCGSSFYKSIGFKITAENKEDQEFLNEFFILYEDSNGSIETVTSPNQDFLKFYTYKYW